MFSWNGDILSFSWFPNSIQLKGHVRMPLFSLFFTQALGRSGLGGALGSEGWEGTQQGVARQGSWVELTGCSRRGHFHSHPDTTVQGWLLASVSSSHTSTMKRLLCSLLGLLCTQVCCESGCQHSGHLRGSGSEHGGVGWGEQLRSPAELPPSQRAWVCSGLCGHCNDSHPCLFLCF